MENLIFYKDSLINRQIAFILNIEFNFIDDISEKISDGKILFVMDDNVEDELLELGYEKNVDYINFEDLCGYFDEVDRQMGLEKEFVSRDFTYIESIPSEVLSLSEMFIKVLYSEPKDIDCKLLEVEANVDYEGFLWGCCPVWITKPFGNVLYDDDPYDNYYARMIKLSSINKTFCFCNLYCCKYYGQPVLEDRNFEMDFSVLKYPKQLTIATDKTCNLRCNSCRKCFFVPTDEEKEITRRITDRLMDMGWFNKTSLFIAGQGEVFYSPEYLRIINDPSVCGKEIKILSNGTLFDEEKWNILESKFEEIHVAISIDAAKKETYTFLRHGNFDQLMKNLKMLAKKRAEGKIFSFQFNYVVQRRNMNEIIDFIKLAKSLNVDIVQFSKLNNWGTMSDEEYDEICLVIDDYLDYDLYKLFQDPIFEDKMVNIDSFANYIENSKIHYGE